MINYNISTTSGAGNSAPEALNTLQTGIGAQDIHVIGDKYMIDIYGDMLTHKPLDTPLLTIIEGLGGASTPNPYPTWNDDYNGHLWADLKFDVLRTAHASAVETAGEMKWVAAADLSNQAYQYLLADTKATMYFVQGDSTIIGKKEYFVRNLGNLLSNLGYQAEVGLNGSPITDGTQTSYCGGHGETPLYVAFEDLYFAEAAGSGIAAEYQKHQIIAKIHSLAWGATYIDSIVDISAEAYAFELVLDFSDSNCEDIAATSIIMVEEINAGGGDEFTAGDGFTRISRMGLIGDSQTPPDAIAEGSNFQTGGNYNYSVENIHNMTQIFDTPKYGVTGTRQASNARFFDEFQLTRGRNLSIYKQKISGALLRGVQSEVMDATTGKPKRTMSGILDYSMFPIRYMKESLPSATADTTGVLLSTWLDSIVYSMQAFKQSGGSSSYTVLCSQKVLNTLAKANSYIGTGNNHMLNGGIFTVSPPSKMTIGLRVFEYESIYGTIRFIHEPSFDMMPVLKSSTATAGGVPKHLFGAGGLNPRNILMVLDKAYIKKLTLRPDKIYGNIQDIGQDAFEEAMRGEHSLQLRFPRNHAIIDVG